MVSHYSENLSKWVPVPKLWTDKLKILGNKLTPMRRFVLLCCLSACSLVVKSKMYANVCQRTRISLSAIIFVKSATSSQV